LSISPRSIESPSPGEGAVPGGDGVGVLAELEEHVAVVILDDRVALQLIRGLPQVVLGEIELL
jgi:hypothetical protein